MKGTEAKRPIEGLPNVALVDNEYMPNLVQLVPRYGKSDKPHILVNKEHKFLVKLTKALKPEFSNVGSTKTFIEALAHSLGRITSVHVAAAHNTSSLFPDEFIDEALTENALAAVVVAVPSFHQQGQLADFMRSLGWKPKSVSHRAKVSA